MKILRQKKLRGSIFFIKKSLIKLNYYNKGE